MKGKLLDKVKLLDNNEDSITGNIYFEVCILINTFSCLYCKALKKDVSLRLDFFYLPAFCSADSYTSSFIS